MIVICVSSTFVGVDGRQKRRQGHQTLKKRAWGTGSAIQQALAVLQQMGLELASTSAVYPRSSLDRLLRKVHLIYSPALLLRSKKSNKLAMVILMLGEAMNLKLDHTEACKILSLSLSLNDNMHACG